MIDHHVAVVGSANFTSASRTNAETVLRLSGPCVDDVLSNVVMGSRGSELFSA